MLDVLTGAFELLAILTFGPLVGFFAGLFRVASWQGPAVIVAAYLLLCVAAVLLRKLEPGDAARPVGKSLLALPAVCFGFFVLYLAADTGGFFGWLDRTSSADVPAWTAGAAIGGIALALAFLIVLVVDVRPTIGRGARHEATRLCCLAVAQLMIVILAASFERMGAESTPMSLALGGKVLIFAAVYVFFLLFLATPRLIVLAHDPSPVAVVTFVIGSCYYVWSTLSGSAFV